MTERPPEARLQVMGGIGFNPSQLAQLAADADPTDDSAEPSESKSPQQQGKAANPRNRAGAPAIRLNAGELHTAATEGEATIIAAGIPIYQRGSQLVRPVEREVTASHCRTTKAASLAVMDAYSMFDQLSSTAEWQRFDGRSKDWMRVNPPMVVSKILLARQGQWNFPTIAGVITCPTLRPDGSILSEPGYDPRTRLYHVVDPALKLHPDLHNPTRERALDALEFLSKLLIDFPFVAIKEEGKPTREIGKAVALSGLITPVVRAALGAAPLHAYRAPTAGSGKSYLVDVSSTISTGRPCPVMNADADERETEKRIAGHLLDGFPIVSIDNINGELGGDLLCQAIERPTLRLRPLGGSDITEIENTVTMFCTGNQLRVRGDMVRRTLIADLDSNEERPELREFKSDPVAMIMADRGSYISAALMIVRAYIAAGKPGRLQPVASFSDWSDLVRSALVWLGCEDPALSMEAARTDDPELGELREMLTLWGDAMGYDGGFTVKEAVKKAEERGPSKMGEPPELAHEDLRDAFLRVAGRRGTLDTRTLGKWLLSKEKRPVSRLRFWRFGTAHGGLIRWGVQTMPR